MIDTNPKKSKLALILTFLVSILVVASLRKVITPFIMAAIFSFILTPFVNLITHRFKIKRIVVVLFIYLLFLVILTIFSINLGSLLIEESKELSKELKYLKGIASSQAGSYPDWVKIVIFDAISQFDINHIFEPTRIMPYFTGVVSSITSIFVMLAATFYFLKDGGEFAHKLLKNFTSGEREKAKEIIEKIKQVINNFLLGQLFLVLLMSGVSWISLSILGVKFALILGIFTGIAEIIPIVGPITAGAVAVAVAIFDGSAMWNLPPLWQGVTVAIVYFILRQLEDVFVIPLVYGKTTKLHPAAILLAVILGGHILGILGMIIAVPTFAFVKILFESI